MKVMLIILQNIHDYINICHQNNIEIKKILEVSKRLYSGWSRLAVSQPLEDLSQLQYIPRKQAILLHTFFWVTIFWNLLVLKTNVFLSALHPLSWHDIIWWQERAKSLYRQMSKNICIYSRYISKSYLLIQINSFSQNKLMFTCKNDKTTQWNVPPPCLVARNTWNDHAMLDTCWEHTLVDTNKFNQNNQSNHLRPWYRKSILKFSLPSPRLLKDIKAKRSWTSWTRVWTASRDASNAAQAGVVRGLRSEMWQQGWSMEIAIPYATK